jgi:hypothetical protein
MARDAEYERTVGKVLAKLLEDPCMSVELWTLIGELPGIERTYVSEAVAVIAKYDLGHSGLSDGWRYVSANGDATMLVRSTFDRLRFLIIAAFPGDDALMTEVEGLERVIIDKCADFPRY